jgi:dolichol kinase
MSQALAGLATPEDLRGALILSALFLSLVAGAELWRRVGQPKPEHTRKLVHLGGGIVCLFFPFLVRSPWVVLAMALPLTILFVAGAKLGFLKSLHGVARKSRGAEYYPLAVFLVFAMTPGRPWLYLSAVLVLAVADAFAALIGSRYGVVRYEVEDEHKSLEGSLVFLVIAFLAIHLPVLLLTDLPRPVCVLAALLVAALVTGFEAISLEGADNLFVPVAVVVVLGKITTKPLGEVVFQNLSLLAICLLVAALVWRIRSLNVGGTIAYILFVYGTWSLGNWLWALPAFVGFAGYLLAWYRFAPEGHAAGVKVRTVTRALLPSFAMLALANGLGLYPLLYAPFLAASAAVTAFSLDTGVFRLERVGGAARAVGAAGLGALACMIIVVLPWLILGNVPWIGLAGVAGVVLTFSVINAGVELRNPGKPDKRPREWTGWRFLLSFAAAGAVVALEITGWLPLWNPTWPRTF